MGVVGGIVSGIAGMASANSASNAQERASNAQLELARETRDLTRADLAPYVQAGNTGNQAYLSTLGLANAPIIGGTAPTVETYQIPGVTTAGTAGTGKGVTNGTAATTSAATTGYRVNGQTFGTLDEAQAYAAANPTGGTTWGGYEQSPGYAFQMQQGLDALQSSAAARGGLNSGATMRDALTYGQGVAAQDYGNWQNRLAALGQSGQAAAAMSANNNTNYAQMGTNALSSLGNAQAAGAIGVGNAFSDMMGNIVGGAGMQSAGGGFNGFNIGSSGSLFGGNSWG